MVKHLKQMLKHNMVDVVGGPGLELYDLKTTILFADDSCKEFTNREKNLLCTCHARTWVQWHSVFGGIPTCEGQALRMADYHIR